MAAFPAIWSHEQKELRHGARATEQVRMPSDDRGLLSGFVFSTLAGPIKATTSEETNEAECVKGFAIPRSKRQGKQWAASVQR